MHRVHHFWTSSDAFDASLAEGEIRGGDVLVVVGERIVGLAFTDPIAITVNAGALRAAARTRCCCSSSDRCYPWLACFLTHENRPYLVPIEARCGSKRHRHRMVVSGAIALAMVWISLTI